MKSIMEEASSITKAIEKAWARAGKPQEFSVKVLEHPETNFFGLQTVKSAKIALFFTEQPTRYPSRAESQSRQQQRPLPQQRSQQRPTTTPESETADHHSRAPQQPRPERPERRHTDSRPDSRRPDSRHEGGRSEGRSDFQRRPRSDRPDYRREDRSDRYDHDRNEPRDIWTPEMVQSAQEWLKETLTLMGQHDVHLQSNVSHNYLKLQLDKSITEDPRHEELQLKSWGSLIIESLREKYNKPLRSLRVIIESRRSFRQEPGE